PDQIGSLKVDVFVNAFQVGSNVILQKSIKEGFGLSVTEAMWKGKAVIGGNVGGIKLQIENGKNGFLVSSPKEAAKRITQLIKNPELSQKLGEAAHQTVKEKFLMPRLLRDYLKLFKEVLS
ncbi:MAG: glycosyl transferase family 1, partial [Candidatus Nealsonbacteria bacterium CG_4_8_14_3_um_filter_34_13]